MSEWSHLPNADHIDWVISSVKKHPETWGATMNAAGSAAWGAAYGAARDAAYGAAWSTISALIAWDHSAKYLKMTPDQLQVWYALSDDPACILLLPAVMVLQEEMEMV